VNGGGCLALVVLWVFFTPLVVFFPPAAVVPAIFTLQILMSSDSQ